MRSMNNIFVSWFEIWWSNQYKNNSRREAQREITKFRILLFQIRVARKADHQTIILIWWKECIGVEFLIYLPLLSSWIHPIKPSSDYGHTNFIKTNLDGNKQLYLYCVCYKWRLCIIERKKKCKYSIVQMKNMLLWLLVCSWRTALGS